MRYLQHTKAYGLVLDGNGTPHLQLYVDASHGDCTQDRRSTTGILSYLGNSLISWTSTTQKCVARSTTESEYVALSDAAQEAVYLQRLAQSLGLPQPATIIYEDNQGCIKIANNEEGLQKRTKHIDIRYHYVKDLLRSGRLLLQYCRTEDMVADIMTKSLGKTTFVKFRSMMGVKKI